MMVEDDLRAALARTAGAVAASPDPMERLLDRHRRVRRRRGRWAATGVALASVLALVAAAVPHLRPLLATSRGLISQAQPPGPPAAPTTPAALPAPAAPATTISPVADLLMDSPVRGSLATDLGYLSELRGALRFPRRPAQLPERHALLLVSDVGEARVALTAVRDDSLLSITATIAPSGASPERLAVGARYVAALGGDIFVKRFSAEDEQTGWTASFWVALAPAGCAIASSTGGTLRPDGTVSRAWSAERSEGYVVGDDQQPPERWRVRCAGVIRYEGPARDPRREAHRSVRPPQLGNSLIPPDPEVRALATGRLDRLLEAAALRAGPATVLWSGTVPGGADRQPVAVATAVSPDGGCAVLLSAWGDPARLAVGPAAPAGPTDSSWSGLVATAASASPDLVAVRLPRPAASGAGWSGQVLVVAAGSAGAVRLRATTIGGGPTMDWAMRQGGTFMLELPGPGSFMFETIDADGRVVASTRFVEPAKGGALFGEPIIEAW